MKLGLRLLFGFFLITGLAAFFVLRVFVAEIKPSVRDVMEDLLVDTANILAELAAGDLAAMPSGGTLQGSGFSSAVQAYAQRPVDAQIWGLSKRTLDYRVYVTDASGRVVFDSGFRGGGGGEGGTADNQDYSRWNDVSRTLAGRYGARATRELAQDDNTSSMYVAAPVKQGERIIGVLTVAKPVRTVEPFVERAQREILVKGGWLMGLSLAVGIAVTAWVVGSVRQLRNYAQRVQLGEPPAAPVLSGELGDLARAIEVMQQRLQGREHVDQVVRALTHELKSPLAAIGGAAELLADDLPAADRQAFAGQIGDQTKRMQALVERMLELSTLEHRRVLDASQTVPLMPCVQGAMNAAAARVAQRGITLARSGAEHVSVQGDAELIALALSNLFENAIDFSAAGQGVEVTVSSGAEEALVVVRDHGVGVPPYALARLGERFFSTPRPAAGPNDLPRKGSGLGLAIVRQVMALHRGRVSFEAAEPGLRVTLHFPLR
jgi:two-component system, OmpR family, sensor histidine kinase CreC